jgi:hypothetical protein
VLRRTAIKFVTAAARRELRYGLAVLAVLIALAARIAAVVVTDIPVTFWPWVSAP